jgi:hypothetical protein
MLNVLGANWDPTNKSSKQSCMKQHCTRYGFYCDSTIDHSQLHEAALYKMWFSTMAAIVMATDEAL